MSKKPLSVTQARALTEHAVIDEVRHDTTDVDRRDIDLTDIEAAYRDATGRQIDLSLGRTTMWQDQSENSPDDITYQWKPDPLEFERQGNEFDWGDRSDGVIRREYQKMLALLGTDPGSVQRRSLFDRGRFANSDDPEELE